MSLSCFKTYDIRGEIDVTINEEIAYKIGRAVAQHFKGQSIILGFDARETSPIYGKSVAKGIIDSGCNVLNIGLAGTEEMYWAVTQFSATAGIEITASHNPINYNGMKIVKSGSQPLDDANDFKVIKRLVESEKFTKTSKRGKLYSRAKVARSAYVKKVLSFIDIEALKPLKIVVNSGNGAAGPTFDDIAHKLNEKHGKLEFVRVNHSPDYKFPNGIPNPILPKNQAATADIVKDTKADFGVAFDGDFDRCFFFDETGSFVQGEYIVGLLASIFLDKEANSKIVHDPRVVWNTKDIIHNKGGFAIQSKTGHAFIKEAMRSNDAIYGGELSAHHYFRDFAYCDSGMIPWILVSELISQSGISLGNHIRDRSLAFSSSGELNFHIENGGEATKKVLNALESEALLVDKTDGISLTFKNWRFNLRSSNTEPLVRLNVETCKDPGYLKKKVALIETLLDGIKV